MGQRSQIIIKVPEVYYNENNLNNRKSHLVVYHNQWLYGMGFLNYLQKLLKAIKHYKDDTYMRNERLLGCIIGYANNSDLDHTTRTHEYMPEEYSKDYLYYNKVLQEQGLGGFLDFWDNNNGYLFINITKDNVTYDIVSGLEDTEENKQVTPKEYLHLFYSDKDLNKDEFKAIYDIIEDIMTNNTCQLWKSILQEVV